MPNTACALLLWVDNEEIYPLCVAREVPGFPFSSVFYDAFNFAELGLSGAPVQTGTC